MKCTLLAVIMLAACISCASGESTYPAHQQTTPPSNGRFEVVQSPLAARWTFRLDRFSGRVSQIASMNDNVIWENMEIINLPKIEAPSKPRFQIFTSGIAARHTFLLDTETGDTWMVVVIKKKFSDGTEREVSIWQPFEE